MTSILSPTDSGINEPMNDQLSPTKAIEGNDEDIDDFEELDETLVERLVGLTEMFPEPLRNGFVGLVNGSIIGAKSLYGFSRSALWVLFTSSAVLLAPLALEMERSQMEEFNKQQQRQILLGPSAALSGGPHNMPMPPLSPPK